MPQLFSVFLYIAGVQPWCTTVFLAEGPFLDIQLKAGQIRGKRESVPRGHVLCFWEIPYSQPPIGDLRFVSSRPVKPWNRIHDATESS